MPHQSFNLLEVENLSKSFPLRMGRFGTGVETVKAVDGVYFYIKKGETLGLVGESGSARRPSVALSCGRSSRQTARSASSSRRGNIPTCWL
jgi:ABC-type microcin C transport system duplicated ATPase subunit YejF